MNFFDKLKSGNLNDIGNTLNSVLGGATKQANQSAGGIGDTISNAMKGSNVGGMLGSAAVGGILGALFSGKSAKKMAKGALTVGGAAALGGLAWNFYQKWSQDKTNTVNPQASQPQAITSAPTQQVSQEANTALILIEAMVYAARADGHIDEDEKQNIHNAVEALFPGQDISNILDGFLSCPVDPNSLANKIVNPDEARDLYRLSCVAINIDSFMERSYLDGLAAALKLTEQDKFNLEQEAIKMKETA